MSEGSLFSPRDDCLTTPKESLKTPKFREFHDMSGCLAALKSPRDLDSINTPLLLPTPLPTSEGLLSTPTLGTPRTADPWNNLFSPLASTCSSPTTPGRGSGRDPRPSDLPLDSSIGLSSPHDGVLAKRRKLKNLNSSHSRSVESDSNSCDTPTTDSDSVPRDLSKKGVERERSRSDSSPSVHEEALASPRLSEVDRVRDRVGAFAISTSPSWRFKEPKRLPESLRLSSKDVVAHPSPLAVPSPNWTTISRMMSNDGLALQTPKVLDNFVFDVLPPNTPNSLKSQHRERSPEHSHPLNYEKHKSEKRPCLPDSPPPPYPEDLSIKPSPHPPLVAPKQEPYPDYRPPSPREVKEEPQDYGGTSLPRDFPPYYLQPGINPQHFGYRSSGERPASPPASPPSQYQARQFYPGMRHPGLSAVLGPHYDPGHAPPPSHWWPSHHPGHELAGGHLGNGHLAQQGHLWRGHPEQPSLQGPGAYSGLKHNLDKVKCEARLSTESLDYGQDRGTDKKGRKSHAEEGEVEADPNQPPKKRGKGKGKAKDTTGGPKRVFICPHCQRSYDWNYNLNRHLKYECGKENAFMCSKCGRRFPHKQNCVYHLKRKHKIICETIDQYVSAGLVVFQGNPGAGGQGPPSGPGADQHSPNGGSFSNSPGEGGVKEHSVTPPPPQQGQPAL